MAGHYGLKRNISFTFQAVKNLSSHSSNPYFRLLCNSWGHFWVYLGVNSFSQGISKIDGNRKFVSLLIGGREPKSCPPTWGGCPFGGNQLPGGIPKLFFFFSFNPS